MKNESNNIINLTLLATAVYLLATLALPSAQILSASGMFILAVFAKIALK